MLYSLYMRSQARPPFTQFAQSAPLFTLDEARKRYNKDDRNRSLLNLLQRLKKQSRVRQIANGVYVGVVNRVGFETGNIRGNSAPGKGLEFWGASFFCDPFGRVIAEASHDKEEILLGEVDLRHLEDIRRNWPFLRDRRIDAYAPITSRMID